MSSRHAVFSELEQVHDPLPQAGEEVAFLHIGGGLGGLDAGLTGVRRFGGGGAGLAAIGLYVGENPMNVINALISAAIAFVATFAILWFIGFDDVPEEA